MKPEILKFDFKQQTETPDTLDLYIYSAVAPDAFSLFGGEVKSKTSADFFREQLEQYKDVKNINLYINSAGGSVREGYGIYAQLKRHPAQKTVHVDGFANSIASLIAMAGDKIIMRINSMMGIHNAMDICLGNANDHRKCADDLDKLMEGNRQVYLARSNGKITLDELTELLDAETMLTAKECKEYGFCDEIAEEELDAEQTAQMMQRMNANMAAQAKYYQTLRQSFNDAMDAFQAPTADPPPMDEPLAVPLAEPQENKTHKFITALFAGRKDDEND